MAAAKVQAKAQAAEAPPEKRAKAMAKVQVGTAAESTVDMRALITRGPCLKDEEMFLVMRPQALLSAGWKELNAWKLP